MVETVENGVETVAAQIRTAVRHTAVYGMGSMLAKAIGFLMLPFYTHYLSPADYGVLEILDLSMSLFGMFLNLGITAALLKSYAAASSAEEKRQVVSTAFLFVAVTGIVTFLLLYVCVEPLSAALLGPAVSSRYLLLSLGSFALGYIGNLPRTYFRALEASGTFVLVDTASLFVMLALNIYFIAFLHLGLAGILWSSLLVGAVQAILLCGWTLRRSGIRFSRRLLREMMAFGAPLIFSNLALFALNFSDRFFLQHLRSVEVVGIYAVGYKFAFMLNYLLVQPFYVMWQSRMYAIHAEPDHPKIFSQIFVFYSLLLIYAGLALSILSPELVQLMAGPRYAPSRDVIPIVSLAYVFYGVGYFIQLGMFLANKTNLIGGISAFVAVLNLGLNYILIQHYGMLGAAWATLVSFVAISAASYWFSQRVLPLPLQVRRVATAMLLAIALYVAVRQWTPDSLAAVAAMKLCTLAVFPLMLYKMRILSPCEIATLVSTKQRTFAAASRFAGRTVAAL